MEWVVLWMVIGGLTGALVGRARNRQQEGAFFGVFLGPIGWLLVLLGPDHRRVCPDCRGVVPEGASKCMHCASELPAPVMSPRHGREDSYADVGCPRCGTTGKVRRSLLNEPVECPTCKHCYIPSDYRDKAVEYLRIKCPQCAKNYTLPSSQLGQLKQCVDCHANFQIHRPAQQ